MPTSAIESGISSAVNRSANAGGNAVNSVTTTRISQMWFVSQTGPIARKIASRRAAPRGLDDSAIQTPPPKSAPANIAYAMRPMSTTPAASTSSDMRCLLRPSPRGRVAPSRPQ